MPPMPIDVYPLVFGILAVALTAGAMELRASLRAPVGPRCVHCRHAALERRQHDLREQRALAKRLWGLRDDDLDDPDGRP